MTLNISELVYTLSKDSTRADDTSTYVSVILRISQ